MMVSDSQYQCHAVFGELDRYIVFYKSMAESVLLWVQMGAGKGVINIDSYLFSSIQGTLSSILGILRDGRINDAYALLRKYYDSTIINIYSNLYLEKEFGIENLVVVQIADWVKGKMKLPDYRIMSNYIRSSQRVELVTAALSADDRYKRLRVRCNDYTHYNFYKHVLLNDNAILLRNRGRVLGEFSTDLRDLFVQHIAYLFFVQEHYMMSSDYVDALECGIEPEPDSQYWVAPFVQEIFNDVLKRHRPDLAEIIRCHTKMHLAEDEGGRNESTGPQPTL